MRKHALDENMFDKIDCEWKAYFLGIFCADGDVKDINYSLRLGLKNEDKYILKKLNDQIYGKNKRKLFLVSKGGPTLICGKECITQDFYLMYINSKKIYDKFQEYDITSKKSFTLKFLDCIPDKFMHHFLRGYFDGDGNVCYIKGKMKRIYMCCSEKFSIGFDKFIKSKLGFNGSIYYIDKIYKYTIYDQHNLAKLYTFLYSDATLYLKRKKKVFKQIVDNIDWQQINKPKHSKYRGVCFDKRRNLWIAMKKHKGKNKFLGYFNTEKSAYNAFLKYEKTL